MKKIIILIALIISSYSAQADGYKLHSSVIGGGATVSGGNYRLSGSVSQPNVGLTEGTGYSMKVGFWNAYLYKLLEYPTIQASNVTITNQNQIAWTRGNGERVAVFMKQANTGTASPTDNATYTANTEFGSGTQISESGWYCIYDGTGTGVTVYGLSARTDYIVHAVEYKGTLGAKKYKQGTATNNPRAIQNQTITFDALAAIFSDDNDRTLTATSTSNLTVSFSSSNEAVATIVDGKIHPVAAGTCSIYANQAGDNYYYSATQASQPLTVNFPYFKDGADTKFATWSDAVANSNGTLTQQANYTQDNTANIANNISLNLNGFNFLGTAYSTISSGKAFTLSNIGVAATFSAGIAYGDATSELRLMGDNILGDNFFIPVLSASGNIVIGDGGTSIINAIKSENTKLNGKVTKILVKSNSMLNLSK